MLEFTMLFNVSGLIQEGIGATRTHEIEGTLETEGREPEPLKGQVELLRTKDGVLVRAHIQLVEPETCSRCLQPLKETLSIDFEEEFMATVDVQTGQALSENLDEDAFRIDQNHLLDLTEAVRQYREASAEMQPLCRPDCKGLCPTCGKDLNTGKCDCNAIPEESPWAALAGLLPKTEGKE
jgi:uncharacterized protein